MMQVDYFTKLIADKFERKGKFYFQEVWIFPKDVREWLKDLFKSLKIKPQKQLCHLCSGKSRIGKIRIDINKNLKQPTMHADIIKLSKKKKWKNSQKIILIDPPWQLGYADRRYFSYAVRDILKKDGITIFNSPWCPEVKGLALIRCYKVRQAYNSYRDLVDFWLLQKI